MYANLDKRNQADQHVILKLFDGILLSQTPPLSLCTSGVPPQLSSG